MGKVSVLIRRKENVFQILIVEDDKELSQLFQKVLEKNGYQVKSASDGAQQYMVFHGVLICFCDKQLIVLDIFLIKQLHLKGTEKILDLACGFGRHSLEFARRGYDVTGIDITPAYIDYANEQAKKENLNAKFICQDIRTITFDKEFDVVLNMADGAIGYLEDDGENHKIFSVIAKALKNGGKHFMNIMNGSYAQTHFPCKLWDAGEKGLTLSAFEWEKDRKTLIYGQVDYMYGEALYKPEMKEGNPIRLYSLDEITEIFCKLGLRICNSFADFSGKPSSDNDIQLMIYSIRE